jgi:histidine kinase-like protein
VPGYVAIEMSHTAELRLPADREYVVVAKRAAGALGSVAGFDLDGIDELSIAVVQAFENAIACLEHVGVLTGEVRLGFKLHASAVEVTVRTSVNQEAERRAREELALAQVELARAKRAWQLEEQLDSELTAASDLALRLMGLFVDASSYRIDERTGGLRVRLTKYRAS